MTDFEYNFRIYTPVGGFEENGILAKLIYKDGLDFAVGIVLSDVKVVWLFTFTCECEIIFLLL